MKDSVLFAIYKHIRTKKMRTLESSRLNSLKETIDTLAIEFKRAEKLDNKNVKSIFNIAIVNLIVEYELSTLVYSTLLEFDELKKKNISVQISKKLYSSSKILVKLFNTDFQKVIKKYSNNLQLSKTNDEIKKNILTFFNNNKDELFEDDSIHGYKRYIHLTEVEPDKIFSLASEFKEIISVINPHLTNILQEIISSKN